MINQKLDELAQTTSRADEAQKKIMSSIWWDYEGIITLEILPRSDD